jgi:hypothetical protein
MHKLGFGLESHVGRTRVGMEWSGVEMVPGTELSVSRILIISAPVKEIRDNLQHWLEKAYFVTWHSSKHAKAVHLHGALALLLKSEAVLPGEIGLVPVVGGLVCDGEMRMLK